MTLLRMLASQPGVLRRAKLFNAFGVRPPANFRTAAPPDVRWRLCPTELVCDLNLGLRPGWGASPGLNQRQHGRSQTVAAFRTSGRSPYANGVAQGCTPTALRNLAQGCALRATLGSRSPNCLSTLKGLRNVSRVLNPFRVGTCVAMGLMLGSQPGVLRRAKLFNAFGVRPPANFRTAAPPDVRWRLCPTELICDLIWGYAQPSCTPTALHNLAQGCAPRATLGSRFPLMVFQPKG